mmetsp:Transcript_28011/g.70333  ORF Transcript_28011/g.70333 Transcript_28011/m.70333 type:complete len:257 (-) Transcript_28011:141-911(-)|eukprot:CAMPEP_0177667340 /NCGR_PEP_ID=MMETSP0447-20121125/22070_1 /TAXON_ID=0 /ORGANISM="Stygamoeba regulata, Strain BSH-02190019" /LENGTH=256 /DNA_ID=CAMNT_0019173563 /DNA_START=54 /DNA_END=824 /DNA_ORIENTATION=+
MCDRFVREVLGVTVAQLCASMGYQQISKHALETLVDVLERYLDELGRGAMFLTQHAGRTEPNFLDVLGTLPDLNVRLLDLLYYAAHCPDVPFSRAIPAFPIPKKSAKPAAAAREQPDHIPSFLPPLPDPHTFSGSQLPPQAASDARSVRKEKNKRKRQVEASLTKLADQVSTHKLSHYAYASNMFAHPLPPPTHAASAANPFVAGPVHEAVPTPLPVISSDYLHLLHELPDGSGEDEGEEEPSEVRLTPPQRGAAE